MLSPGRPLLTNPRADRVKSVRALARRSVRAHQGEFLAEGPAVVREALTWRPETIRQLYLDADAIDSGAQERLTPLIDDAERAGIAVTLVTSAVFAAMSDTQTPAGVLAVCRRLDGPLAEVIAARPKLLAVLAQVRDPGNVGTVIRAADAAGADAVVVSDASVDVYNPKAVRATAGSLFHLPLVVGMPIEEILAELKAAQIRVLATTADAEVSTDEVELGAPHAWLFGNEAWGLPDELQQACDERVCVPIYGRAESLNLATAATVCLYASARAQRNPRSGGESAGQGIGSSE